jgi:hypothetical protein
MGESVRTPGLYTQTTESGIVQEEILRSFMYKFNGSCNWKDSHSLPKIQGVDRKKGMMWT